MGLFDSTTAAADATTAAANPMDQKAQDWFGANQNASLQDAISVGAANGLSADQATNYYNQYSPQALSSYDRLINDAYGDIGRTGIGGAVNNIDQGGYDYWKGQLASGAIKPEDFGGVFGNAVNQYITGKPTDPYTQYVQGYQKNQAAARDQLNALYQNQDYTGINSLLAQTPYSSNQIAKMFGLDQNQLNEIRGKGVNLGYTTPGIQNLVTNALGS